MRTQDVLALEQYHRRRCDQERALAGRKGHPTAVARHDELRRLHELMLRDLDTGFVEPCFRPTVDAAEPVDAVPSRVLLIEDCATIRAIVQLSLGQAGDVDLHYCSGVTQSVAALASAPAFDVVLLDMNLTDGTGLDVLDRLHSSIAARQVPIVLFTASDSEDEIARYVAAGVVGVIRKPFDPFTLYDELARFMRVFAERPSPAQ